VLSADPTDEETLPGTRVLATVVGGALAYERGLVDAGS
jgi:hypothetical protein